MSERQNAFTIKTNQLSDEVYDILAKYAKSRKLGDYISSLIVRDLHSASINQVESAHRTEELLEHINSELQELKQLAKANGFVGKQEELEDKPSESQTLKEGKIADLEQVSGSLDDDDLEEYSDF
jgi:ABC-type nitrate/sulfonate/bicarbonate transport system substrate-binding protein